MKMPRKHQIDRRRHRHTQTSSKPPEDELPFVENQEQTQDEVVEPDESDSVGDKKEDDPAAHDSESDKEDASPPSRDSCGDEDDEASKSESEPDNPDDEDFVVNESSSEDDDISDNDDYAFDAPSARNPRRRPAAARARSSQRRAPVQDEFLESEEESDAPSRPTRKRRGRGTQNSFQDSSEEEEYTSTRSSRQRRRRVQSYREDSDSAKSNDDNSSPTRRSTPSRASARRAKKKLHETLELEEELEEENEDNGLPMITPKKRKKGDEEEYDYGNEEEDEEEALSAEDDVDSLVDDAVHNVDNDSFCSADSSKDGDDDKPKPSPALDIRSRRRRRQKASLKKDSSDEDEASISEFQTSSPMVVSCSSTHDVITADPLPEKHVCYVTPDKKSRQCFALETLHKIAMTSPNKQYREEKQTFLQPPHFRSAMSDDLLDQIASRFGRAALDLGGYFYNRDKILSGTPEEYDYMVNFDGSVADTETFMERLNDYISNLMGHQDIYCCPLCYIEAYRYLMNPNESGDDDEESEEEKDDDDGDIYVFSHDPMSILGSLDDDKFHLASTFCFTKIAQVKKHLRDAHHIDTSVLDGNGLFTRFKVRATKHCVLL